MLFRVIIPLLLPLGATASGSTNTLNRADLRTGTGPCNESFPLAPPDTQNHHRRHERRLVAIRPGDESSKYYETGEYYAPLCPDGRHIDIRKLQSCNGEACWDERISHCTFECIWGDMTPPKPTDRPTPRPTFPQHVETEHHLLLSFRDLLETYRMNPSVRAAMIRYLFLKLKNDLEDLPYGLELLELTSPGRLPGMPHALPLKVVVKGPSDISDFVLSYIELIIRDSSQEIVTNLKKLDGTGGKAFKDASLSIETYNFDGILEDDILEGSTNPPSKSPRTVETVHPVQLILKNVPPGYRPSAEVRSLILRFITEMLEERLDNGLELIKVEYAGRLKQLSRNENDTGNIRKLQSRSYLRQRRLEAVSFPLRVTVSGPADISDFALSYIMETIRDRFDDLAAYLLKYGESLDGDFNQNVFTNVELSTDTFNFDDIVEPEPVEVMGTVIMEETTKVPWWVWLIAALVILLCCICCVCFCIRRRRSDAEWNDAKQDQEFNVFMQNDTQRRRRPSHTESRGTRKSQHRPRSVAVHDSDQSRRTTRTKRTHKTRSHHPAPTPARAPVVAVTVRRELYLESDEAGFATWPVKAFDAETAVSALRAGDDPPEESSIVLYNPHPQARYPTFYTDCAINPDQVEPEGGKVHRSKSIFADAALMKEVRHEREEARREREEDRRERDEARREREVARRERAAKKVRIKQINNARNILRGNLTPEMNMRLDIADLNEEGFEDDQAHYDSERVLSEPEGLTSDEPQDMKKKNKSKKKSRKKKGTSSKSKTIPMGDNVRTSNSRKQKDMPIDIEMDPHDSDYDSPSILTNHESPPGMEEQQQARTSSRSDDRLYYNEEGHPHSHSRAPKKMEEQGEQGLFSGIDRKSSEFVRDGISSDDESFHAESEEDDTGRKRRGSYGSYPTDSA
mmetsp:Transcript_17990/g.32683  ORF Transcript_17990/g.32683 Transcript_17990/m.32683 type:complete len:913 (-) Transcript_17990:164-2902(-)